MKKLYATSVLSEGMVGGILVIILLSFLNSKSLIMPMNLSMFAVATTVVLFLAYASTIWKESVRDEREDHHRLMASRFGYLVGAGALVIAAIVQLFQHDLNPWVIYVLVAMISSKIVARMYFEKYS
ncbi:hypothetical protein KC721_03085 [Candidatus Woesebacteria bacterium]|nr:hypothetical protein [Candidatus Woesebacteria bacterium]